MIPAGADPKGRCWYNSAGHYKIGPPCNKAAKDCHKKHDLIPREEFDKMIAPVKRSASQGSTGGKGKGKGKGKGEKGSERRANTPGRIEYCGQFMKNGTCTYPDCKRDHLTEEQVKALRAKGKGKGSKR